MVKVPEILPPKRIKPLAVNPKADTMALTLTLSNVQILRRASDGFVNLSQLCKAGGKTFKHWSELQKSKAYLEALSASAGKTTDELVGYEMGSNSKRATWGHPQVAINIAQWISPEFDVQVSKWIYELGVTGKVDLGKEKSQVELDSSNADTVELLRLRVNMLEQKLAEIGKICSSGKA
jgi:hypothetical protein